MTEKYVNINPDGMELSELKELSRSLGMVVNYCDNKIRAMEARLDGKIEIALDCEDYCDKLYFQLPECVKSW